jgi:large subunit ribosomal protein L24e
MPTCSFCKRKFKEPQGLTIFTFEGKSIHYCSSKCRRNVNLGRDARKLNWVRKYKEKSSSLKEVNSEINEKDNSE